MEPLPTFEELWRQAEQHLQSLRRAGVDLLPAGPPLAWSAPKATVGGMKNAGIIQGSGSAGAAPSRVAASFESGQISEFSNTEDAVAKVKLEERRKALKVLAEEVKGCTKCPELCSTRTQTVFAQGEPGVELCFVGEAPGADEDAQGIPFVGAAGQLLTRIIEACGLKREEVYICNILKCRPPKNRTPLQEEADNCRSYLERQIDLVKPKFICALGGCAATNLLKTTASLGSLRRKFHDFRGIPVLVTYHPAYLLPHRAPEKKKEVWEDMKLLLEKMGRPIPAKNS